MGADVSPEPRLACAQPAFAGLVAELHRRTEQRHESGAFLLGDAAADGTRRVRSFLFYDDLDPLAYASGVCILHGDAFGRLWKTCADRDLAVVADVHVHAYGAGQSRADQTNPMIARAGHLALILPDFARAPLRLNRIGFYQYLGDHHWRALGGAGIVRHLILEP